MIQAGATSSKRIEASREDSTSKRSSGTFKPGRRLPDEDMSAILLGASPSIRKTGGHGDDLPPTNRRPGTLVQFPPVTERRTPNRMHPHAWRSGCTSSTGRIESRIAICSLVAGVVALLVTSFPAYADNASRIAECRAEIDSLKRLVCYDAIPIDDMAEAAGTTPSGPIATFEGTGMTTTRPFKATGPIVVRVETESFLSLEVRPPAADFGTAHLSTDGSSPAELYVPKGGTYLLEVTAMGRWKATVTSAE